MDEIRKIKISELKVPKYNVRVSDIERGLDDLKTSIKSIGLIEPITVFEKDGQHTVLVGQRRLLAYSELNKEFPGHGFDEIDCIVRNVPDDDIKRAMSLEENILHLQMSRKDITRAVTDLYNKFGNYDVVREKLGLSRYMVDKYVGLSRLPEALKQAIQNGELHHKQTHAERIALNAVDALQYTKSGSISEDKVLEFARALARKSNIGKEMIAEAKKNPLRDIDEIQKYAEARQRIQLNLYLSPELDSRLGQYSEQEAYGSKEDAAVDIIAERLDAGEG